MVSVAVVTVVAATVAWLCLRRVDTRLAPDVIDLIVVVMVSLTAALTLSEPVF